MSDHPFAYYDPTHDKLLWAGGPQYVHAQRTEGMSLKPLYLHPPTRPFVRLSDKEIAEIAEKCFIRREAGQTHIPYGTHDFAQAITDALDEKNK